MCLFNYTICLLAKCFIPVLQKHLIYSSPQSSSQLQCTVRLLEILDSWNIRTMAELNPSMPSRPLATQRCYSFLGCPLIWLESYQGQRCHWLEAN
jgi:hypothetical protein